MTRRKLRRARIARNAWARIAHRTLTHLDGEPAEPTSVLRDLYPADLVVPSRSDGKSPRSKKSLERLKEDCERVGVTAPPHARHSMRASFVTWLDEDGARESIARVVTHGRDRSSNDARRGYARHGWEALCAEVAKLQVQRVTDDARTARKVK